ncbi:MAG: NUDIX domain-containing protein [Lachnospiraceae bacterium]|nr:NUDIX domain-containing protein [Lachnospiraceae bacterium]
MECFDLYDKDRIKTGKILERGNRVPKGYFRLVIHVCIFNTKGEMLIQRREPKKDGWAGMWDISAGGSAVCGDNSQTAAEREVKEELGIDISLEGVRPALTIHFDEGFNDIYTVIKDVELSDLKLQECEVCDARWASEEEILSMLDSGEFVSYTKSLIPLLFFMRNHNGAFAKDDPTK